MLDSDTPSEEPTTQQSPPSDAEPSTTGTPARSTATKATAKKATAKRAGAKKTTAKKAATKKTSASESDTGGDGAGSGDTTAAAEPTEPAPATTTAKKSAAKSTATKSATAKTSSRKTAAKKTTPEPAAIPPEATATDATDAAVGGPPAAEGGVETTTTTKKTSRRRTTKKAAEVEQAADGSSSAPAVPAPLFQPPEPVESAPRTAAGDGPDDRSAREDAASGGQGSTDPGDDDGDASGGGSGRRRRRRGGRRRRKPSDGGEDAGADAQASGSKDDAGAGGGQSKNDKGDKDSKGDAEGSTKGAKQSGAGGDTDDSAGKSGSGSSRRRRRRSRTGEDRAGHDDDPDKTVTKVRKGRSPEDEITSLSGSTRLEAKKQRRREGREAGRRRAPIVSEAEYLARREAVERQMVIRERDDLTQIAVLEDKVLVEHYVSRESQTSLIGNVYLGRVQNVLPSMEAAFIDIGKGRNAVLYAGEVNWDALGAKDGQPRKIESVLKSGQSVLVQVTKDPVGHKGARLTSQISLPGRFLVYVPDGNTSGISRKLPDTERARLKSLLKEIVPESAGVIVRTAAEGASEHELTRDVERLTARWEDISAKVAKGNAPQLLYGEPDLTLKVVRDLFTEDFSSLVISGNAAWDTVDGYVQHVAPDLADRLHRHEGDADVFAEYRIDEQIAKGLDRKVWLPSGGSLIIDRTEAMTVVDVNTGKFTGSGGNLEETVTKNNLEAAEEMVRQLRLRDLGGIIVIDFIDMVLESNRDLVLRRLIECLGRDRTRHQVAEVTSLGLVQMTRKRIGTGLLEAFSEGCDHCQGRGLVVHTEPVDPQRKQDDESRRGRRSRGGRGSGGSEQRDHGGASSSGGGHKQPSPIDVIAAASRNGQDAGKDGGKDGGDGRHEQGRGQAATPPAGGGPDDGAQDTGQPARDDGQGRPQHGAPVSDRDPGGRGGEDQDAGDSSGSKEPAAAPPPTEPAAPRLVTGTRRRSARRAAGPPPEPSSQPSSGGSETTQGSTDSTPERTTAATAETPGESSTDGAGPAGADAATPAPVVTHVPVKQKGTRRH